jgi:cofilin
VLIKRVVLKTGMIFKIIIKYMKLDDEDDESADVKEALRLWVLNKVQKYDVGDNTIKTLTKPFHNGLIFCALIHHMRPKLIDYDSLDKKNGKENLELALSIAEKYCNVQRYISVDDISALDELGMVVYVYDWYYGISLLVQQDIVSVNIYGLQVFVQHFVRFVTRLHVAFL